MVSAVKVDHHIPVYPGLPPPTISKHFYPYSATIRYTPPTTIRDAEKFFDMFVAYGLRSDSSSDYVVPKFDAKKFWDGKEPLMVISVDGGKDCYYVVLIAKKADGEFFFKTVEALRQVFLCVSNREDVKSLKPVEFYFRDDVSDAVRPDDLPDFDGSCPVIVIRDDSKPKRPSLLIIDKRGEKNPSQEKILGVILPAIAKMAEGLGYSLSTERKDVKAYDTERDSTITIPMTLCKLTYGREAAAGAGR